MEWFSYLYHYKISFSSFKKISSHPNHRNHLFAFHLVVMEWEIDLLVDQPLGKKLIKKGFWLYFFTIFIWPAGYLIRVLVSNSISVADVGIVYSVMGLVRILATYHDLWFTEALQYHLPKYWIQKKYNAYKTSIYLTLLVQVITWLVIAAILFFGADFLAAHYFHSPESAHIIKIFCLYFLWLGLYNILFSIYIAFQDIIQNRLIELIRSYSILIFSFCFILLGSLNMTTFTRAWVIGIGVALVFSFIVFIKKYSFTLKKWQIERSKDIIHRQVKYALRVFIGTNVAWLLFQLDQQFAIYFLWAEASGYYTNYTSLISLFTIITAPILSYIFPLTTELIAKNHHDKLILLKNMFYKYFSLFAISISWLFIVFGREISTVFFGQKFIYSWYLVEYSAIFLIFNILFSINFWFLAGMGKVKDRAKIIFFALIINIILSLIFIQLWWLIGIVIAMIITWIVLFYLSYRLINRDKQIVFDRKYIIKNIIGIAIVCIILYYIKDRIFVLEDAQRYRNFLYLGLITIGYYLYILGINYKNIVMIKKELRNTMNFKS